MACVALTSLTATIELEFLQPTPRVSLSLHLINSFLANLYALQAVLHLQEESSALTLREFEIRIRDFALKAEDDIEIQLSNILVSELDSENREKASHELHQTLRDAAKNATELLKIISSSRISERDMASVALTILIAKVKRYLLQPFPMVYLGDEAAETMYYLKKLRVLLQRKSIIGGAAIEKLVTQIRNFALKAEDDIEIQLSNLLLAKDDAEHEEEAFQELRQTLQEAAEIADEIINKEQEPKRERGMICVALTFLRATIEVIIDFCHGMLIDIAEPFIKSTSNEADDDKELLHGMVGRDYDYKLVIRYTLSDHLKLISIVGMPGIGKTIQARRVYQDPTVKSHFNLRCWITMPQKYNERQMLLNLLGSITQAEPNGITKESTLYELAQQVYACLKHKRFLIVLDNFWNNPVWDNIKQCFPRYYNGSCILLTTTHFDQDSYASWPCHIHNMTLLDPDQSWDLFCNTLSIERHMAPKFEEIRRDVVEKCDGLPQLIVVVAKRLSKCNNIKQKWKKIEKELESLGILDRNQPIPRYNQLPQHLKVCFLYLSAFPKRCKILAKTLIRLWIAEGFVKPLEHKELGNQAYECLQQLIDRSLLLVENQSSNGKIKTCRMHSAMHTFCVGEAQKEGMLCAVNTLQHSGLSLDAFANSCRWLSVYSHSFDCYVLFSTNIPRSIFPFHESPEMFVPLKLLRVLAFNTSISPQRVPMQLGGLVFLRYLSITQWFEDLDDVVLNNPNLERLVVSGSGAPTVHLPSSIWKPPQLRHLELGNSYMVDPPSADKKNLQTLSWVVRPIHCKKKMYNKFPNIKNLKMFLKDEIEPNHVGGSCSNPITLDHFDYLVGLKNLSISVSIGCNAALPEHCMYPSGLKKLKLNGTNISERDLNAIAMLPELMVLKLENAFHGKVWNAIAKGGFPRLIFLLLEAKELEQWVVSWDHFPMLSHLVLRSCNCLEQMPKGFAEIYSLEKIEFEGCHSSLVASANDLEFTSL